MNKSVLIDTNAYGEYLSGNKDVYESIINADTVYMSVIVLGELHAGFKGGRKIEENIINLKKFISKSIVKVLPIGTETAEIFGVLKNELKLKGTPIPTNDVWIAANCIETTSLLITFDKHFRNIDGIKLWK